MHLPYVFLNIIYVYIHIFIFKPFNTAGMFEGFKKTLQKILNHSIPLHVKAGKNLSNHAFDFEKWIGRRRVKSACAPLCINYNGQIKYLRHV